VIELLRNRKVSPDVPTAKANLMRKKFSFDEALTWKSALPKVFKKRIDDETKKNGGTTLSSATVCGYDNDLFSEMEELEDRLKVPVRGMEPRNTEDIYKPALGAAGFVWANLT